jgi:hypothetical protein
MTTNPPDELASRIASLETTRIALVSELESTRRDLWKERALRRFPTIEPAIDLIPHVTDEASYQAFAERLARYAAPVR